jgi:diguanylate cyclase (GGDEF)-like protein
MLDMAARAKRARTIAMGAVGVGLLATTSELGWWVLPLMGISVLNLVTIDRRIAASERPERVVAWSGVLMTLVIGAGAALTGGGVSPALAWLVLPVAVMATRFRAPVVWLFAAVAGVTALAVTAIGGVGAAFDEPLHLMTVLVLLVGVTAVTTGLMDAELHYRSESVLDPLTGLQNRSGLEARFAEVAEQARLLDRPVCLVLCDLDNFKTVNDLHGHERGDAVLRDVSYLMRGSLRSFELFYRLGGEEFLLLLPGIDLPKGLAIAEGLRTAVAGGHPGDLDITASLGVSVAIGDAIDFLPLYRAADDALYRAKDGGRNLVIGSGMSAAASRALAAA